MITEQTVKDFQEVVREEYGVILDIKEARSTLESWVGYFDLLAKINHRSSVLENR